MRMSKLKEILTASKHQHPLHTVWGMMEEAANNHITIRPSGIVEFLDNPFSWAVKQIVGVISPSSEATVLGTAVHAAAEFGYRAILDNQGLPSVSECAFAIDESLKSEYKWLENPSMTIEQMTAEAIRLFTVYHAEVMPNANPLAAEANFVLEAWEQIKLAGTTDRIEKRADGSLAITDIKTSAKNLSGEKVDGSDELKAMRQRLKELNKLSERHAPDYDALKENGKIVKDIQRKLGLKKTTEEEKATLQVDLEEAEATQAELQGEVDKWLEGVQEERDQLQAEIDRIAPDVEQRQYQSDCLAAMHKHGLQLASYAFLYEAATGQTIDWGRIEVIIKYDPIPVVKVLEFPLAVYKRECAMAVDLMVETIEALRAGTPARLLFRMNPETFRGSELTDMVRELVMTA